ncbi:MAG: hypothetical protein A2Y84_01035, partial [Candidatus Colwellbacteria bacterium RBG_13_48_8]
MRTKPLLGAHVSAAGGLYVVPGRADALGAEAVQVFGASPRQWKVRLPNAEEIRQYRTALFSSRVRVVFLHAAYLVNLATPDKTLWKKSVENLSLHFEIAQLMGAEGLILHIGSSGPKDRQSAFKMVAEGIREVFRLVPGKVKLIMENSSGGGGKVGSSIEDLTQIFKMVKSQRLGLCFDTAHAFEAGIIRYEPGTIRNFFDEWDKRIGL